MMLKIIDRWGQHHWVNSAHIIHMKPISPHVYVYLSNNTHIETSTGMDELIHRINGEKPPVEGTNTPWDDIDQLVKRMKPTPYP